MAEIRERIRGWIGRFVNVDTVKRKAQLEGTQAKGAELERVVASNEFAVIQGRIESLRRDSFTTSLNTKDDQERLKALGATAVLGRFFNEIKSDIEAGHIASRELEKLKG